MIKVKVLNLLKRNTILTKIIQTNQSYMLGAITYMTITYHTWINKKEVAHPTMKILFLGELAF